MSGKVFRDDRKLKTVMNLSAAVESARVKAGSPDEKLFNVVLAAFNLAVNEFLRAHLEKTNVKVEMDPQDKLSWGEEHAKILVTMTFRQGDQSFRFPVDKLWEELAEKVKKKMSNQTNSTNGIFNLTTHIGPITGKAITWSEAYKRFLEDIPVIWCRKSGDGVVRMGTNTAIPVEEFGFNGSGSLFYMFNTRARKMAEANRNFGFPLNNVTSILENLDDPEAGWLFFSPSGNYDEIVSLGGTKWWYYLARQLGTRRESLLGNIQRFKTLSVNHAEFAWIDHTQALGEFVLEWLDSTAHMQMSIDTQIFEIGFEHRLRFEGRSIKMILVSRNLGGWVANEKTAILQKFLLAGIRDNLEPQVVCKYIESEVYSLI